MIYFTVEALRDSLKSIIISNDRHGSWANGFNLSYLKSMGGMMPKYGVIAYQITACNESAFAEKIVNCFNENKMAGMYQSRFVSKGFFGLIKVLNLSYLTDN